LVSSRGLCYVCLMTTDDEAPKSALDLAMARLRKKDVDEGVSDAPITEEQRQAIAEVRTIYDARLAEREILHQSSRRRIAHDPEAAEALDQEYRRDRERVSSERDRKIEEVRKQRS
jgi:hypothetical protein